jgi:hypothetical protein
MCGASEETRKQTSYLSASIFLSMLLNGTFFVALLGDFSPISPIFYSIWLGNLFLVVKITLELDTEGKIISAFVQVPTILIHIFLIYLRVSY